MAIFAYLIYDTGLYLSYCVLHDVLVAEAQINVCEIHFHGHLAASPMLEQSDPNAFTDLFVSTAAGNEAGMSGRNAWSQRQPAGSARGSANGAGSPVTRRWSQACGEKPTCTHVSLDSVRHRHPRTSSGCVAKANKKRSHRSECFSWLLFHSKFTPSGI